MNLFFAIDIYRAFILLLVLIIILVVVNFFLRKIDTNEACLRIVNNELYFRVKKKWISFDEVDGQIEFVDSQHALRIKYLKGEFIANIRPGDYLSVKGKFLENVSLRVTSI